MPIIDPDQGVPLPAGTDLADNPVAFSNFYTPVNSRINLRYTTVANRTALHPANIEGEESYLTTDNRKEINDGANWISAFPRSLLANNFRTTDSAAINNSVALVTDAVLSVPSFPAGSYQWELMLIYSSSVIADLNVVIATGSATSLYTGGSQGPALNIVGNQGDGIWLARTSFGSFPFGGGGVGAAAAITAEAKGQFTTTGAGVCSVQYAQNSLDPTNTVVHAGSRFQIWRVA